MIVDAMIYDLLFVLLALNKARLSKIGSYCLMLVNTTPSRIGDVETTEGHGRQTDETFLPRVLGVIMLRVLRLVFLSLDSSKPTHNVS